MASDTKFDKICEMIEKVTSDLKDIKTEISSMSAKFNKLEEKIGKSEADILRLEDRIKKTEESNDRMLKELKKNNIILFGYEENANENGRNLVHGVYELLNKKMMIEMGIYDINFVKRIGIKQDGKIRPIVIAFNSRLLKYDVLSNARTLKGSNMWIGNDYTRDIVNIRKELVPYMIKAKKEGRKCYLRYDKIVIEQSIYSLEDMKNKIDSNTNIPATLNTEEREEEEENPKRRKLSSGNHSLRYFFRKE